MGDEKYEMNESRKAGGADRDLRSLMKAELLYAAYICRTLARGAHYPQLEKFVPHLQKLKDAATWLVPPIGHSLMVLADEQTVTQDDAQPFKGLDLEDQDRMQRGKAYTTWVMARTEARVDKIRKATGEPCKDRLKQVTNLVSESKKELSDATEKELNVMTTL